MRILLLLTLISSLTTRAQRQEESITLSFHNASMEDVFREIKKQSSYSFVYTREQLGRSHSLSLQLKDATLAAALKEVFKGQPFTYTIEGKHVVLKDRPAMSAGSTAERKEVAGTIMDESGIPVNGATVTVKRSGKGTATDAAGNFTVTGTEDSDVLVVTAVGFHSKEVPLLGKQTLHITLSVAVNKLDETLIIAYGTTTKRLSTGNVSKLSRQEIEKQPVTNPLAALQGRIAGLSISQSNGLPGANFNVQIRGRNSLKQGNQPLYIIDGVNFMLNTGTLSQITPSDINNPFNAINPSDIESIEVLKDADATAIYGSQGANGVVIITTKKGRGGKTKLDLNFFTGIGKVTRTMPLLSTADYLAMRKEAFQNDGLQPSPATAPDLFLWDSTAYTDWKKEMIGGTSKRTNLQLSLSGGNAFNQFLISGNYSRETTVFPFDKPSERGTIRLQLDHRSGEGKLRASFSSAYSNDTRNLPFNDLTRYIYLPPNTPAPFDAVGNLTWANWINGVDNPYAQQFAIYHSGVDNYIGNLSFHLEVAKGLSLHLNGGYNHMNLEEVKKTTILSQRPSATTTGSSSLAVNRLKSYLVETQAEYRTQLAKGEIIVLAGLSAQQRTQTGHVIDATGYTSDDLLGSFSGGSQTAASNTGSRYKYLAGFGRVKFTWAKKYVLNLNGRRDGSSRFGPANRFSNFGSIGAAWIFSEEKGVNKHIPFLSYGKIRGSYGITGNDQIGDYQYLDSWSSSPFFTYQQQPGILPNRLLNPYFGWESNTKWEMSLELGMLENKVLLTTAYYRNRSGNQLVNYRLPQTTGFTSILRNLDAVIQNKGFEVEASSRNITNDRFEWTTSFNVTIPKNKLIAYPGLEASSDKNNYVIGEPLSIVKQYEFRGVNGAGVYQFADVNGDGVINTSDISAFSFVGQRFYGGLSNEFRFGPWQASFFVQFVKQDGRNYLATLSTIPGNLGNQPIYVLDRWRKPGDETAIQRFSSGASAVSQAYSQFQNSTGSISDASFVRLKNVYVAYVFPQKLLSRWRLSHFRIYLSGQNLLTFTRYKGADPETQSINSLPPLRVFTAGIQVTL